MYTLGDILWYYRHHGLQATIRRILSEIRVVLIALVFGFYNLVTNSKEGYACIIPRASRIDQDTVSLLSQHDDQFEKLYVAVSDPAEARTGVYKDINTTKTELVKIHNLKFIQILALSETVITKDRVWQYRLFAGDSKRFIRVPHGISAKDAGPSQKAHCNIWKVLVRKANIHSNYKLTAASQLEYHRMVGILGVNPENLFICGYPRYDRIRYLVSHSNDALISESAEDHLNTEAYTNILYAPTHKDGAFETEIFPFPDYNEDELKQFLSEHNVRIFIRMHVNEEDSGIAEEYIDGETIFYAGHDFSPSVAEILPFFDALITDYSSVYLDYVLFDRPILFVPDDLETYRSVRGFAFGYNDRYWPGPKIESQQEFLKQIKRSILDNEDEYIYERQFVRDTFHPPESESFLENIT